MRAIFTVTVKSRHSKIISSVDPGVDPWKATEAAIAALVAERRDMARCPVHAADAPSERDTIARIIREKHRAVVCRPSRTNEPRRTFHQGDIEAADLILALVSQRDRA